MALLIMMAVGLSACATDGMPQLPAAAPTPYPPPGYTHRVGTSQVVLYWNCTRPDPGILQVEGLAYNPWTDQPVRFLEFDLVGVDTRERTISQVAGEAPNFLLRANQSTPFRLDLRTSGAEIRFDLFYRYRFQEKGGSFIAGQAVGVQRQLAQMQQFMVRDACSETQHLAR
jgi:hypothetical protein